MPMGSRAECFSVVWLAQIWRFRPPTDTTNEPKLPTIIPVIVAQVQTWQIAGKTESRTAATIWRQ